MKRFLIWTPILAAMIISLFFLGPKALRPTAVLDAPQAIRAGSKGQVVDSHTNSLALPPARQSRVSSSTQATHPLRLLSTKRVLPAFDDFARWVQQFTNGSGSLVEGERRAWKRREAMLELIQSDPATALSLTAPFAWRQALPSQVTRVFRGTARRTR